MDIRTCIYTFESPVTLAVASRLVDLKKIHAVVLQRPMSHASKVMFLRRRLSRHGALRVLNELLFQLVYALFLRRGDERVRRQLPLRGATKEALAAKVDVFEVDSLNDRVGRLLLERLQPDLVVMMAREILSPAVLAVPKFGFVGCHPGILPDYRGAYAPFWAMRDGRRDKVGLTVYVANEGIDTGPLIAERVIEPKFAVRHFKVESDRLLIEGAEDLADAIDRVERGALMTYTKPEATSRLFSHVGLTHFVEAMVRCSR